MAENHPVARSVLICQSDEPLNHVGLARWLGSFTDLAAIVVIHESWERRKRRMRREIERVGWLRFMDVLAFQCYYRLALARRDRDWEAETLRLLERRYPPILPTTRTLRTNSPNSEATERLLRDSKPDFIVARCKTLLSERVFRLARSGTFVMHPGICPEYRNAHGCFWALAERDLENVGMTLLQIDAGVDTGPVYGYFRCDYDELRESHSIIQNRMVFDNLDALKEKFHEILAGTAKPLDTAGRKSGAWGQPWLTKYRQWKAAARKDAPRR